VPTHLLAPEQPILQESPSGQAMDVRQEVTSLHSMLQTSPAQPPVHSGGHLLAVAGGDWPQTMSVAASPLSTPASRPVEPASACVPAVPPVPGVPAVPPVPAIPAVPVAPEFPAAPPPVPGSPADPELPDAALLPPWPPLPLVLLPPWPETDPVELGLESVPPLPGRARALLDGELSSEQPAAQSAAESSAIKKRNVPTWLATSASRQDLSGRIGASNFPEAFAVLATTSPFLRLQRRDA
jgi:hypothetical protein